MLVHPACEDIEERIEGEGDLRTAICIAKRRGKTPSVQRFSVADAKRAGLWNKAGPWQSYPDRMLQMRARGFSLRDAFPDALKGLMLAEEAQDIPVDTPATAASMAQQPSDFMPKAKPAELPADIPHEKVPDTIPEQGTQPVIQRQPERKQEPAKTQQRTAAAPSEGVPTLTEGMVKVARTHIEQYGADEADVLKHFGVAELKDIHSGKVNELLTFIKKGA